MKRPAAIIAIVLVLLAGGSVLTGFLMSLAAVELQEAHLPGPAPIRIDQGGTWLLWKSTGAGGTPVLESDQGVILDPAPTVRSIVFSEGETTWEVAGRFEMERGGDWTLSGGNGAWALGLDPLPTVKFWSLLTVSAAIVLLGGAACSGWIAFRGGRAGGSMRRQHPGQG